MRVTWWALGSAAGLCSACGLVLAGTLAGGESARAQASRNEGAFQWYAENLELLKSAEKDFRCSGSATAFHGFLARARSDNEEKFAYKSPLIMSEFSRKLSGEIDDWRMRCTAEAAASGASSSQSQAAASSTLPSVSASSSLEQPAPSSPNSDVTAASSSTAPLSAPSSSGEFK